jgi:hypothetical protein
MLFVEIFKLKYADIGEFISIQRQKNKIKNTSKVLIQMNDELADILNRRRQDNILVTIRCTLHATAKRSK